MLKLSNSSTASGIKCKNAPPINAPADKLTKCNNILFSTFCFIANVSMPIKEIRLTKNVLKIIHDKVELI